MNSRTPSPLHITAPTAQGCPSPQGCSGDGLLSSDNVIAFPVSTSCSGRTMPGLTTPELRRRARDNFYSSQRRVGVDPATAYDRAEEFEADLERIAAVMRDA